MEDNVWAGSDDAPESHGEYSIYLESLADQMHADLDEIEGVILRIEERLAQPPPAPAAKPEPEEKPEPDEKPETDEQPESAPNPAPSQPVLQGVVVRRRVLRNNGRRGWNMLGV